MEMEKDWALEVKIGRAIDQLNMAQKKIYSDPKFCMALLAGAEDRIQSAYIRMIERTGGVVKK